MCIIAVVPEGLTLLQETINNMWSSNRDGAGFMYAENGQLHVHKGFMTLKDFMEAYEPHAGKKLVLHFRIKTHGETNAANTHPFIVDDTLAFVHNGVVGGYGSKEFSDTYHFNEELIKPLREQYSSFLHSQPIKKLIKEHIGYSKLVFLNSEGEHTIINEDKGEYSNDGIWFSNSSWKTTRSSYTPRSNYGNMYGYMDDDDEVLSVHQKKDSANDSKGTCNDGGSSCNTPPKSNLPSKFAGELFKVNDEVFLNLTVSEHFKGIPKYSVGRVAWFTSGYTVAVKFYDEDKTEYIPAAYLDKVYPISITKPIGHLHKGDYVLFDTNDNEKTRVIDTSKKKAYWIPTDAWEHIDSKLVNTLDFPWNAHNAI